MSTIKSSDEHLTLNADGTSKDIKFQANGVEKASIDSNGNLTVSGNLTSLGIDDNADATAITISSAENVGIGATSPSTSLHLKDNATAANTKLTVERSSLGYTGEYAASHCGTVTNNEFDLHTNNTLRLRLTADGRGLSEFTAKAWASWNGSNTATVRDSHNVSSVSDNGTGHYSINFANNLANINYVASGMSGVGHFMTNLNAAQSVSNITIYTTDHAGNNNDKPYNYLMVIGA